jgi:signal transduction histidine kinase
LENAIDHSEGNSPDVHVSVNRAGEQDDLVEIRVMDEGDTIAPTEIEPLERGTETPIEHGSGLGLWVVKWMVERFGGELEFKERSPRGNIVLIRLQSADLR